MARLPVFVSFTKRGGDGEFIRRLIARLEEQPLVVWKYEDDEEEIPGGQDIPAYLRQQIEGARLFVPVVSLASFQSAYTRLELEFALHQHATGRMRHIIPLVSHRVYAEWKEPWPDVYQDLERLRHRVVEFDSPTSLEEAIIALCADAGVDYRPPLPQDPRLPFLDRFVAEIREKCPRRGDREIGIYRRLMIVIGQFAEAFEHEQFERARWLMQLLGMMCEFEFPDENFYYPHVVRGVCELLAGQREAAEDTFQRLRQNPLADESVYGALGYLYQQRRDYAGAKQCYQEALRFCPHDPAAKVGLVVNSILAGEALNPELESLLRDADQCVLPTDDDRKALCAAKAIALASGGHFSEASRLLNEMAQANELDAATVVHFTRWLQRHGRLRAAVQLLEQFRSCSDDAALLQQLTYFTAFQGDLAGALQYAWQLVVREPSHRQYRVDAAQLAWRLGDVAKARDVCAPLLNSQLVAPPQSANDFFLDGFAQWICGNVERANYDFQRSGFPHEKHYSRLLR
jgi:Flp pilus assembly protein TadD